MADEDSAEKSADGSGAEVPAEATPTPAAVAPAAGDATPAKEGAPAAIEPAPESGDPGEAYHRRARLAEDRLQEVLGAYRKLKQENEGYRDRVARNIERRFDQRRERLLTKFIDILDNLDRALEAAEQTYAGEPLIEGLILVRTQLLQTLQDEGLERIPVIGLPYDPQFSEAVEKSPVDDPDSHNVVVKELIRGYRLSGRIVRPSQVIIGEYRGDLPTPPQPSPVEAEVSPSASEAAPEPAPVEEENEPNLEEIISRTETRETLFPRVSGKTPGETKRTEK